MTEYKTFDDYVRAVFKTDPTELTHISPEEQKKNTVAITADELINIWNELTDLKIDNEILSCSVGDFSELQDKYEKEQRKNNGLSDNLTKAKNLLENFIRKGIGNVTPSWSELIAETKRFLKDCEVKQ